MTHEQLINQGWIQTDGSCFTLQYAKKVNDTTWLYRQWVDIPFHSTQYDCYDKLIMWDSGYWEEDEINISKYPLDYIKGCISTFGYSVVSCLVVGEIIKEIIITDGTHEYSVEDSIQLACECIFELEN